MVFDAATGCLNGNLSLADSIGDITRFDMEIAMDTENDCTTILSALVGSRMSRDILSSMKHPGTRVSANRPNAMAQDIPQFDVLGVNMPARSGNYRERLRSIPRWCRVFVLPNGIVSVYEPLDESRLKGLRWPHNGIMLNRSAAWYQGEGDIGSIDEAIRLPVDYLDYNLDNWKVEEALWRIGVYTTASGNEMEEYRQDMAVLASFIKEVVLSTRALQRRTIPCLERLGMHGSAESLRQSIRQRDAHTTHARSALRDDIDILSAVSQLLQSRASDRLNSVIETLSALFLVPSVIISFFSMSILSSDTSMMWLEAAGVLLACMATALITFVLMRRRRHT